jgi:hypothetical protein
VSAAGGLSEVIGLKAASVILTRERLRVAISSVIGVRKKREYCVKFLQRVIGRSGVEELHESQCGLAVEELIG